MLFKNKLYSKHDKSFSTIKIYKKVYKFTTRLLVSSANSFHIGTRIFYYFFVTNRTILRVLANVDPQHHHNHHLFLYVLMISYVRLFSHFSSSILLFVFIVVLFLLCTCYLASLFFVTNLNGNRCGYLVLKAAGTTLCGEVTHIFCYFF